MSNKKYIFLGLVGLAVSLGFTACSFFPEISNAKPGSRDEGKYGYVDKTGKILIPAQYDDATDFKDGVATVGKLFQADYEEQLGYGLINTSGQFLVPIVKDNHPRWDRPSAGSDGLIPWDMNNRREPLYQVRGNTLALPRMSLEQLRQWQRCGYKNTLGQMVIPAKFDACSPFNNGLAAAAVEIKTQDPAKIAALTKRFKNLPPGIKEFTTQEYGLIDKTGTWVIQPAFSSIHPDYQLNNLFSIEVNGQKGYLSRNREVVLTPDFSRDLALSQTHDLKLCPKKNVQVGVLDSEGKIKFQQSFDFATAFEQGLVIVRMNNQSYWINVDGTLKPTSELQYNSDLAKVQLWDGSSGFVDNSYKWAIKPRLWSLTSKLGEGYVGIFHNGRAILKGPGTVDEKEALAGFHTDYSQVIASYRKSGWSEARIEAAIEADKKRDQQFYLREVKAFIYGAINTTGDLSIAPNFAQMDDFSEGLAVASNDANYPYHHPKRPEYGYIDINGNWAIPSMYARARKFKEGLAAVKTDNGLWGFIDNSGKFVLEPKYAFARDFDHGFATVITGQKGNYQIVLIDHTGKVLNHPVFDQKGSLLLHPDYEVPGQSYDENSVDAVGNVTQSPNIGHLIFKDGMARVFLIKGRIINEVDDNYYYYNHNSKIGFLNLKGQLAIQPQFDEAEDFKGGIAKVKGENGLWGYIDKLGHFIVPPKCKELGSFNSGLAKCKI